MCPQTTALSTTSGRRGKLSIANPQPEYDEHDTRTITHGLKH
jgi:hypothetical protein